MIQRQTNDHSSLLKRLIYPSAPVRAVLDTDTFNEIDDQFALTYALLHPEQLALEAVYAAPFLNSRSESPADGMQKSLGEIRRILELVPASERIGVFGGSEGFLCDSHDGLPVCDASKDLIERSKQSNEPLYVISIGAPTNIANALLQDPTLRERVVIVWLGGNPIANSDAREFNLYQDLKASRILFESGAPLILVPCKQVAELLMTTIPELRKCLDRSSPIGEYLLSIAQEYIGVTPGASRPIWDLAAVALLVHPEWFESVIVSSPQISDDLHWIETEGRHPIRVVTYLKRDPIIHSFFAKLSQGTKEYENSHEYKTVSNQREAEGDSLGGAT